MAKPVTITAQKAVNSNNTPGYQNAQRADRRAKDTHTVISGEEETNGLETKGQ